MNCQEVYVGGGSYGPVLECTQPEGHDGWHRNDFGVAWGDPVEAACVIFGERAHISALDARATLGPVSGDGIARGRARGDFPRLLVDLWGMASRVYVRPPGIELKRSHPRHPELRSSGWSNLPEGMK